MQEPFLIGYARVSTEDQDLRLQIEALERYGVPRDQIIDEKASGGRMDRKGLKGILKSLREGDQVVVWKLDRLGRSLTGVIEVVEQIHAKGAELHSITEKIDTSSAMGRAFFHITLVFAELERSMISERTKAGIAARLAADPDAKWGAMHFLSDVPERMEHVQGLYNGGEFRIESRPSEAHPDAVLIKGMTAQGLLMEINAVPLKTKGVKPIKNAETVRRWLRSGAPGLER